jgi:hypothetical protein
MQKDMLQERISDEPEQQLSTAAPSEMAGCNPENILIERPFSPDYHPVNGKHGPDDEDEDEAEEEDLILGDADEAEGDEEEFDVVLEDDDFNEDDIDEDDLVLGSDDDIDDEEDDL